MCNGTSCGAACVTTVVAGCVVWGAVASALLYFTWNHVIAELFSRKKARFTQALLVVATVCVFCLPGKWRGGRHGGWGGCKGGECAHGGGYGHKRGGDCKDCDEGAGGCKHGKCEHGDCKTGDCKDCDHQRDGGKGPCPYERDGDGGGEAGAKK